jgi:hypothetical protein
MITMMATEALLHHPDHNLPFAIYMDASNYQLGMVIMQNGHPVS